MCVCVGAPVCVCVCVCARARPPLEQILEDVLCVCVLCVVCCVFGVGVSLFFEKAAFRKPPPFRKALPVSGTSFVCVV